MVLEQNERIDQRRELLWNNFDSVKLISYAVFKVYDHHFEDLMSPSIEVASRLNAGLNLHSPGFAGALLTARTEPNWPLFIELRVLTCHFSLPPRTSPLRIHDQRPDPIWRQVSRAGLRVPTARISREPLQQVGAIVALVWALSFGQRWNWPVKQRRRTTRNHGELISHCFNLYLQYESCLFYFFISLRQNSPRFLQVNLWQ